MTCAEKAGLHWMRPIELMIFSAVLCRAATVLRGNNSGIQGKASTGSSIAKRYLLGADTALFLFKKMTVTCFCMQDRMMTVSGGSSGIKALLMR